MPVSVPTPLLTQRHPQIPTLRRSPRSRHPTLPPGNSSLFLWELSFSKRVGCFCHTRLDKNLTYRVVTPATEALCSPGCVVVIKSALCIAHIVDNLLILLCKRLPRASLPVVYSARPSPPGSPSSPSRPCSIAESQSLFDCDQMHCHRHYFVVDKLSC